MGYETKIWLCSRYGSGNDKFQGYLPIAMIDLCKIGYDNELSKLFDQGRKASKKRIKDGGDAPNAEWRVCHKCEVEEPIKEDPYGDPLGVNDAAEILDAMKRQNADEPYRRLDIAIAMIEAALGKFENLVILSYGH